MIECMHLCFSSNTKKKNERFVFAFFNAEHQDLKQQPNENNCKSCKFSVDIYKGLII